MDVKANEAGHGASLSSLEMPLQRTHFFCMNAIIFSSSHNMQPVRAYGRYPHAAASEGLWPLPARCLSHSFPTLVLNKHTFEFGTIALKGEEIFSGFAQIFQKNIKTFSRPFQDPKSKIPDKKNLTMLRAFCSKHTNFAAFVQAIRKTCAE